MAEKVTAEPTLTSKSVPPSAPGPSLRSRLKLLLWKLVSLALLIALIVTVMLWKPWQANIKAGERVISVTGSATLRAEPDEFVFYPSYTFTNSDKTAALADVTKKSDEIVAKLKALGVASSKIKTNSSGYSDLYYPSPNGGNTYSLSLTATIDNKDLAQKVQDYLVTTNPSGSVSPSASFSTAKQKSLEGQARDKAEQDARARAEQSAKNLGFKVDAVKSVDDAGFESFGGCGPSGLCSGVNSLDLAAPSTPKLAVQPGENELPYSVKVIYYIH